MGSWTDEDAWGGDGDPRRAMWDQWETWAVIRLDSGGEAAIRLAGAPREIQGPQPGDLSVSLSKVSKGRRSRYRWEGSG